MRSLRSLKTSAAIGGALALKPSGTPSEPKENNGASEECCSGGAGGAWIIGSRVFSHWSLAVVCTNYSLRAARCRSADMLTDRRARGDAHMQTHTDTHRLLIHCQSSDDIHFRL